jgi:hypothetical protein
MSAEILAMIVSIMALLVSAVALVMSWMKKREEKDVLKEFFK